MGIVASISIGINPNLIDFGSITLSWHGVMTFIAVAVAVHGTWACGDGGHLARLAARPRDDTARGTWARAVAAVAGCGATDTYPPRHRGDPSARNTLTSARGRLSRCSAARRARAAQVPAGALTHACSPVSACGTRCLMRSPALLSTGRVVDAWACHGPVRRIAVRDRGRVRGVRTVRERCEVIVFAERRMCACLMIRRSHDQLLSSW